MKIVKIPFSCIRDDFELYYGKCPAAAQRVEELVDDIAKNGLKKPIEIHKIEIGYEVVEGVHRFRAIKKLGWIEVECKILDHGPQATPFPRNRYGESNVVKSGDIF
jgi:uncharacterized ParB-like nuclease family protein